MSTNMTAIRFLWEEVFPNPKQYNQNTIRMKPLETAILVEVPSEMTVRMDDEFYLTPEGYAYAFLRLQQAFKDVEEDYFSGKPIKIEEDWEE